MSNIELVNATHEMIHKFYGAPQKMTLRAIAMVRGDDVLGVGGFYVNDARVVMFSEFKPDGFKYKKAIVKGAKRLLNMAANTGLPVHAVPDPDIKTAKKFLKQLGFNELFMGVWEWRK